MTNIDRAAQVILQSTACTATEVSQTLAAEGLLMPDLPEQKFAEDGLTYWEGNGEAYQPGTTSGSVGNLDAYGEFYEVPASEIRAQALAMLAAAAYVEKNTDTKENS